MLVRALYEHWARNGKDSDIASLIAQFLTVQVLLLTYQVLLFPLI